MISSKIADIHNMKVLAVIVILTTFSSFCTNPGPIEMSAKIRESITIENGEKPRNLRYVYEYPSENKTIEKMYLDNKLDSTFEYFTLGPTTHQYLNGKLYAYQTTATTGECKTDISYYEYSIETKVQCEDGSGSHVRRDFNDNTVSSCTFDLSGANCKKLKNDQLVSQYSENYVSRVVRNVSIIGANQEITETHFVVQFENEHEIRAKMFESKDLPIQDSNGAETSKFVGTYEATEYTKGARTTTFYDTQGQLISTYQNIL